jgi:hypothetical protein
MDHTCMSSRMLEVLVSLRESVSVTNGTWNQMIGMSPQNGLVDRF